MQADSEEGGRGGIPSSAGELAVESYLRYQGDKLVSRFDANCYVHLTLQMDTHDVSRDRGDYPDVLEQITQPALVIGIDSDVLYPLDEQRELSAHIPNARLAVVRSDDGHDAFLIAFDQLKEILNSWLSTERRPARTTRPAARHASSSTA